MYDLNDPELQDAISAIQSHPINEQSLEQALRDKLERLYQELKRQRSDPNWGGGREGAGRPSGRLKPLAEGEVADKRIIFTLRSAEKQWLEVQGQHLGLSPTLAALHMLLDCLAQEPEQGSLPDIHAKGLGDGRLDNTIAFHITAQELEQLVKLQKVCGHTKSEHIFARQLLRSMM